MYDSTYSMLNKVSSNVCFVEIRKYQSNGHDAILYRTIMKCYVQVGCIEPLTLESIDVFYHLLRYINTWFSTRPSHSLTKAVNQWTEISVTHRLILGYTMWKEIARLFVIFVVIPNLVLSHDDNILMVMVTVIQVFSDIIVFISILLVI